MVAALFTSLGVVVLFPGSNTLLPVDVDNPLYIGGKQIESPFEDMAHTPGDDYGRFGKGCKDIHADHLANRGTGRDAISTYTAEAGASPQYQRRGIVD